MATTHKPPATGSGTSLWGQIRKFLVFQIKLYVDAFRDLFLSALSLFAIVLDIASQRSGEDSFFEGVLRLGRRSERAIDLFNQHRADDKSGNSVDAIIDRVEEKIRNPNK